jgi:uncharacterized tellurite resistance protein B-like protein
MGKLLQRNLVPLVSIAEKWDIGPKTADLSKLSRIMVRHLKTPKRRSLIQLLVVTARNQVTPRRNAGN